MHNFFFLLKLKLPNFPCSQYSVKRGATTGNVYICLFVIYCDPNLPIPRLIFKLNNTLIYAFISVHNLTPGDIKVVAGVGDSITVRNGTPHAEKKALYQYMLFKHDIHIKHIDKNLIMY